MNHETIVVGRVCQKLWTVSGDGGAGLHVQLGPPAPADPSSQRLYLQHRARNLLRVGSEPSPEGTVLLLSSISPRLQGSDSPRFIECNKLVSPRHLTASSQKRKLRLDTQELKIYTPVLASISQQEQRCFCRITPSLRREAFRRGQVSMTKPVT